MTCEYFLGHQIFVHGGISEDEEYLNDSHLLSLNPLKWNTCAISLEAPAPCLAWHSCCLVLPSDILYNPKLSIYKLPEISIARRSNTRVNKFVLLSLDKRKGDIYLRWEIQ